MRPNLTQLLKQQSAPEDESWQPVFFRLSEEADAAALEQLLVANPNILVRDQILLQLKDLVKLENPSKILSDAEYKNLIENKVQGTNTDLYGVWVYYPWKNEVVHLLDKAEFIQVRTIRNAYKITFKEQAILRSKRIGVIGLSVGQSAALAIALESIAGEIRIADFDRIELSNLNRLRTNVSNLNIRKTHVVAREIAEIDPFISVKIFNEGINEDNLNEFIGDTEKLDLLVEESDSVDIKILAREECRRKGIPVIMDTSDRGMLDVERFDLDPNYPILHGLIDSSVSYNELKALRTSEDKIPYVAPIVGLDTISLDLKASMLEVGQSITTWPQLAEDVIQGGAYVAHLSRRILLGERVPSKRYWVDIKKEIPLAVDEKPVKGIIFDDELTGDDLNQLISKLEFRSNEPIPEGDLTEILHAASQAPSPGNNQCWKWMYKQGNLFVFLDKRSSNSFGDNLDIGSLVGIGSMIENINQFAASMGYLTSIELNEGEWPYQLVARINFSKADDIVKTQVPEIFSRFTNRSKVKGRKLTAQEKESLIEISKSSLAKFSLLDGDHEILEIGKLVRSCDRIRLMNRFGHEEFFGKEIRWTRKEAELSGDGLDINNFGFTPLDRIALEISQSSEVIRKLNKVGGGKGFEKISEKFFESASAIGIIAIENYSLSELIEAGRVLERNWLHSERLGIGMHPMTSIQMLSTLLYDDKNCYLSTTEYNELKSIVAQLNKIVPEIESLKTVVLFRYVTTADENNITYRKNLKDKFID